MINWGIYGYENGKGFVFFGKIFYISFLCMCVLYIGKKESYIWKSYTIKWCIRTYNFGIIVNFLIVFLLLLVGVFFFSGYEYRPAHSLFMFIEMLGEVFFCWTGYCWMINAKNDRNVCGSWIYCVFIRRSGISNFWPD